MSRRERQDGGEGGEDEMSDVEDCRFWWCCRINYWWGEVELIFERELHKRLEEFANRDLVQE